MTIDFITELTFEYKLLHKNFGMVDPDEPFNLTYEGFVTKLRLDTGRYPETIGVFNLEVYNLDTANIFDCKDILLENIEQSSNVDDVSRGIADLMNDPNIDFRNRSKIIFLRNLMIHPKYKKKGVFEELLKSIYMTQYIPNALFLISAKPIQSIDGEIGFMKDLTMNVWDDSKSKNSKKIEVNIGDYLKLDELPTDDEMNEYKLYAKFQSLNLKQFEDSHFFYYQNNIDFWKFLEAYADNFKVYNK